MDKYFKIKEIKDITPSGMDGHKYRLNYEIGPSEGAKLLMGTGNIIEGNLDIETTGTIQAIWGMTDAQLMGTSSDIAAATAMPFIKKGETDKIKFIPINTSTAPRDPSTLPHFPINKEINLDEQKDDIKIEESVKVNVLPPKISFLGEEITEVRDSVNAISEIVCGDKLLGLPQERALFDMFKIPNNKEEFTSRIASLAGLAVAINGNIIEKKLEKQFESGVGSIAKLEELLNNITDNDTASSICDILKHINRLRKGYPIHGDNINGVIEAHDYFEIEYPINDFSSAWEKIANKYFEAIKKLLVVLKKKREVEKDKLIN